jgi:hypothetical protein
VGCRAASIKNACRREQERASAHGGCTPGPLRASADPTHELFVSSRGFDPLAAGDDWAWRPGTNHPSREQGRHAVPIVIKNRALVVGAAQPCRLSVHATVLIGKCQCGCGAAFRSALMMRTACRAGGGAPAADQELPRLRQLDDDVALLMLRGLHQSTYMEIEALPRLCAQGIFALDIGKVH